MVVSKLDSSISFLERKDIESSDEDFLSPIYSMEIDDITVECVVGQIQTLPYSNKVVYCPIYLIYKNSTSNTPTIIGKIGVYEMLADDILQYRGDNGNVNIDAMDEPLLFSFVDYDYLKKYQVNKDDWITNTITFVDVDDEKKPHIEWSRQDENYTSIYDALRIVNKDYYKNGIQIKKEMKKQQLAELQKYKEYIEDTTISYEERKTYIEKAKQIVEIIKNIKEDTISPIVLLSLSTLLKTQIFVLEKGVDHDKIEVYEDKPVIILYKEYNHYYIVYHKGYNV